MPLPVLLQQSPQFDNFFGGPNQALVETLQSLGHRTSLMSVWLYGARSSGKTHLLRACVGAAGTEAEFVDIDPHFDASLAEFGDRPFLALDNADTQLDSAEYAMWLMRLIDHRRSRNLITVLSAGVSPERLPGVIPDLRTRFAAMAVLGLKPLRAEDRKALLELHARARGLELAREARDWLLGHLQRDAGTLIAALEELDRESLKAQRRLTLPFVQKILGARVQPSLALETARTASS